MKSDDADIFLSGALLGFDKSGSTIYTDDKASSDFGVERAGVTGLFDSEDTLHPRDDFVRGWVGGFVEVDNAGPGIRGAS